MKRNILLLTGLLAAGSLTGCAEFFASSQPAPEYTLKPNIGPLDKVYSYSDWDNNVRRKKTPEQTAAASAEAAAQLQKAVDLAGTGEYGKALIEYAQVTPEELNPEHPAVWTLRSEFMRLMSPAKRQYLLQEKADLSKGKIESAVANYGKTLTLAADDYQAHGMRQQFFDAVRELSAPPSMSEEARKDMLRAELKAKDGDFKGAAEEYNKSLVLAPFAAKLYYNLALVYGTLKDYTSAKKWMGVYLEAAPEAPDARAAKDEIMKWEILLEKK